MTDRRAAILHAMRVDLEKYREAGRIAAECHALARATVQPGVRYVDLLDKIEKHIHAQGALTAFPAQVSVNDVIARLAAA